VTFAKSFELGGDPTFKLVEILALGIVEPQRLSLLDFQRLNQPKNLMVFRFVTGERLENIIRSQLYTKYKLRMQNVRLSLPIQCSMVMPKD
jgi:hypothetical protein